MDKKELTPEEKQRKAHLDNHANQLNETNERYRPKHTEAGWKENEAAIKHRAKQLNPNNPIYRAPKK